MSNQSHPLVWGDLTVDQRNTINRVTWISFMIFKKFLGDQRWVYLRLWGMHTNQELLDLKKECLISSQSNFRFRTEFLIQAVIIPFNYAANKPKIIEKIARNLYLMQL